jgi:TraB/PrgY/gumN family
MSANRSWKAVLAASLALAVAPAGLAQERSDWAVSELVVTAPNQGPTLWKLRRGDSVLWILPLMPATPKGLKWSRTRLERVITGANVVLTPPQGKLGFFDVVWVLRHLNGPRQADLEARMPPDLRARFVQVRTEDRHEAKRYARMRPAYAAWITLFDYYGWRRLDHFAALNAAKDLASRHGVPVRPMATYPAKDVLKSLGDLPEAEGMACVRDSLDDIDWARADADPAARAWAVGDMKTAVRYFREPHIARCLEQTASYNVLRERSIEDGLRAARAALSRPGKSVAVLPIESLVATNGVLRRLRAEGVEVTAPNGL